MGGRDDAVERLGVDGVAAGDGQMVEFVGAVEMGGTRGGATPAGDGGGDDCAAGLVDRDYVSAEDAGDSGRRQRQGKRIGGEDAAADDADVYGVGGIGIENAEAGAIIVAERGIGAAAVWDASR